MDEIQEKFPIFIDLVGQIDKPLLLIEYSEESAAPNPRRRAVNSLLADQLNEHIHKVAICCSDKLRQDVASIEEVLHSRGTPVEYFSEMDDAEAWLLGSIT